MSESLELTQEVGPSVDRRQHARLRPRTLAYAEVDRENGGIILDASESGISVHAVVPLMDDVLPELRLKLPGTNSWLATGATVVWTRDSRKVAGLRFEALPEAARAQIREWLSKEASPSESESGYPEALPEKHPKEENTAAPQSVSTGSPVAELRQAGVSTLASRLTAPQNSEISIAARGAQRSVAVADAPSQPSLRQQATQRPAPNLLAQEPRRGTPIYLLLAAFAVISLASGWAAGRGKFRPALEQFKAFFGLPVAQARVSKILESGPPPSPVSDIEVVDASGQGRMIPLAGTDNQNTPAPLKPSVSDDAATKTAGPDAQRGLNFQIWTLTSPERSAASQNSKSLRGNAPVVAEEKGEPDLPAVGGSTIEPPNPGTLPKPQIMTGVLKRGELIHRVEPEYPEIARGQGISGTVTLEATVDPSGVVRGVRVIDGSKLLVRSAVSAVRQWRYTPTLLDGKPIQTQVEISLVFSLAGNR